MGGEKAGLRGKPPVVLAVFSPMFSCNRTEMGVEAPLQTEAQARARGSFKWEKNVGQASGWRDGGSNPEFSGKENKKM